MFEKYLQDIGLDAKEASVYLALLQVENASVIDIAKKTNINRSTVYNVLNSLSKKGLVSEANIGKKTHYQAESPDRLETYVAQRRVMLEEQQKKLKDIIPQIKSIQRESGERPIIKVLEGINGLMSSYDDFFNANKEKGGTNYLIYPKDVIDELFTDEQRKLIKGKRLNFNIKNKVIYTYSKGELPSDTSSERIIIDKDKYPILCDISAYEDEVRINTVGKSINSIFIKSKDLAETIRSLMNIIFDLNNKK